MKKILIFGMAFFAMMSMDAQHVTPLQIELAEFDLTTMRQEYSDPVEYLAQLQHIRLDQEANETKLKLTEKEMKDEEKLLKAMEDCIGDSKSALSTLEKLYQNEEKKLENLEKSYKKNETTARKASKLDVETQEIFIDFVTSSNDQVRDALKDVKARANALNKMRPEVEKAEKVMKQYELEIKQKELDLKQLQSTHKARVAAIKAEIKTTEAQIKAAKKQ